MQAASDSIQYNLSENLGPRWNVLYLLVLFFSVCFALWCCGPVPAHEEAFFMPQSLFGIGFVLVLLCARSRNNVLGVFAKILMFFLFALAFTTTCMSYSSTSMIQGSELLGKEYVLVDCLHCAKRWPSYRPFVYRNSKLFSWR